MSDSTLPPATARRIVLLATSAVVVCVGAATLYLAVDEPGPRFLAAVASAAALYLGVLAWRLALRAHADPPPLAPFALAGLAAGAFLRLVVGGYRVDGDLGIAAATGLLIGLAHGLAVTIWLRLRRAAAAADAATR